MQNKIENIESAVNELKKRIEIRNSLYEYFKYIYPDYKNGKHIEHIIKKLEDVEKGICRRLIISLPPRHSKSTLVSILFPTWILGRDPNKRIVLASYSQSIAEEQSRRSKDVFYNEKYNKIFNVASKGAKNTDIEWHTKSGGGYYAVGIQGSLTGRGFDIGIIDDYYKDRLEANSETFRGRTLDWYKSVFYTRQSPEASIIIIATRWAVDDLIGSLIEEEKNGEKWDKITFPAINDNNEALWEEMFPINKLNVIKQTVGQFEWSSLYQQNPVIKGGNRFKIDNIKIHDNYNDFPTNIQYVRGWDVASSSKQRNTDDPDYTLGILAGVQNINNVNHIWIKDIVAIREESPKRNQIIIQTANKDGAQVQVWVEAFGAYKDAFNEIRALLWGRAIVNPSRQAGDKVVKASPLEPLFEAGNVHIIRGCPNYDLFIKQFSEFPWSKHDDCLKEDALIKTELGYKFIKDIRVGDMVYTHNNRYMPVKKVIKKEFNGIFYKIKPVGQLDLEVSEDHKIYYNSTDYRNYGQKQCAKYGWVEVKNWKKGYRNVITVEKPDFINNSIYKIEYATNLKVSEIVMDEEFAYILGYFMAEGHANRSKKWAYKHNISFASHTREVDKRNKVKNYLDKLGIKYKEKIKGNSGVIAFSSKILHEIFSKCYDENKEKIIPEFAYKNKINLFSIMDGWISGDGWKIKSRNIYDQFCGSTSKKLIIAMRDIAFSRGWYAVINMNKRHRYNRQTKNFYNISIKYNYFATKIWCTNNLKIRKINELQYGSRAKKIESYEYKGYVYDLQVEEDLSFVANGFIIHNCVDSLSIIYNEFSKPKSSMLFLR